MAHLRLTSGPAAGTRYPLDTEKTVLGRHPNCDIVTDASAVSRYHAQITSENDGLYIEDLKSRNGTFVNEQQVAEPRRLRCDDIIRICDLVFVFHDEVSQGQILSSRPQQPSVLFDDSRPGSTFQKTLDVSSQHAGLSVSPEKKLKALVSLTSSLARAFSNLAMAFQFPDSSITSANSSPNTDMRISFTLHPQSTMPWVRVLTMPGRSRPSAEMTR